MHVDLAQIQPLRRSVGHAAEFVARQPARKRERLGDAEIQHPHVAVRIDADVLRLDIAVHDAVKLLAVDRLPAELVRVLQRLGHARWPHRPRTREYERSAPHQFRQVLPVDVFHGDDRRSHPGRRSRRRGPRAGRWPPGAPAVPRRAARPRWNRGCRRPGCARSASAPRISPCSVSWARYTSAIPPRPSFWRISYLPSFRPAGAIIFPCPAFPCPDRGAALGSRRKFLDRTVSRSVPGSSSSAFPSNDVAGQRRPRPVAGRDARSLVAQNGVVRKPRGRRAGDQHPFRQAVVNRIADQRRAGRARESRLPMPAPVNLRVVDLHRRIIEHDSCRKGQRSVGIDPETAHAGALHVVRHNRRPAAQWRGAQNGLARHQAVQSHSALQPHLLAIFADPHIARCRPDGLRPWPGRWSNRLLPRSPPEVRGESTTGAGAHSPRENQAIAAAATRPYTKSAPRLTNRPEPGSSGSVNAGAVNWSPSTTTTVTLSLPPARLAASISSSAAWCGSPAFVSTARRISIEAHQVAQPVAAEQEGANPARRGGAALR